MTTSPGDLEAASLAASDLPGDTPTRVPRSLIISMCFANFGLWFGFFTPILVTLQVKVAEFEPTAAGRALALSVVLAFSSILGILATPLAGRLSDRTTSRFGMRRPWLVLAALLGVVGLVIEAFSGHSLTVLVIGSALSQIGNGACVAVLLTLIPDHVPVRQRGGVGSILGLSQAVAIVVGAIFAGAAVTQSTTVAFLVPGIVALIGVGVLAVTLKDRHLDPADRLPFRATELISAFWTNPRRHPDFAWAWISRFLLNMALAPVISYGVFYLTGQLRLSPAAAASLVGAGILVETIFLVISNLIAGPLSDRVGRRKPFVIVAAGIGVAGLLVLAFATGLPAYFVGLALVGLGQGVYFAVDVALVADVLPDRVNSAAKDFSVFTLSNQLPQTLAPVVTPVLLSVTIGSVAGAAAGANFTVLYIGCSIFAVLSAVTITLIRGIR